VLQSINLAFSPAQVPYVSFVDGVELKANVMKFDGSSWVFVGTSNFTNMTFAANIAFASTGVLYLVYQDLNNLQKISLMKFDGTNWISFGPAGPRVTNYLNNISMTVGPDGIPYISFSDPDNDNKLTVMKCDGTSWSIIGNAGFSTGSINYSSIEFDSWGNLFVAADDNHLTNVWTYSNSSWNPVGDTGFSISNISSMSFAISPSGKLYTTFVSTSSNKLSLMYYGYPLSIKENTRNDFRIYPDPATTIITFQMIQTSFETKTIVLYDGNGNQIYEMKTNESKVTIPVTNYPAGIYFIRIKSKGSIWSGKFCKI
jgi:hypothetical protein